MRPPHGVLLLFFLLIMSLTALADTDHLGTVWNITTNQNASGYHFNITNFYVQPGITLEVQPLNSTSSDSGWLKINTTGTAYVYGNITGDGRGGGGGSGGGGGGGACGGCDSTGGSGGTGGQPTDQNGTNGTSGTAGQSDRDGGFGRDGGAGYGGATGGTGGDQDVFGDSQGNLNGLSGGNATANTDNSIGLNATIGNGGGGGGGGGGGASQSGTGGAGGSGGGSGGDGGAYLILIARNQIISNGSLTFRSGQNACSNGSQGSTQTVNGGAGGNGSANNVHNCAKTSGAPAQSHTVQDGPGASGTGGEGAGGMIVLASYDINLTNAFLSTTGGTSTNNGTIKLLYKNSVKANGTYLGTSAFVYTNYSDAWFTTSGPTWLQELVSASFMWNQTVFLDYNATNSTPSCQVQNYTSNSSIFPINLTTGIINLTPNISRVGNYTILVTAADNCSASVTQITQVGINYSGINLTSVSLSPSPTGTSSNLTCTPTITNNDNAPLTNVTRWYRNNTVQPLLENKTLVTTGNLTLTDQWICSWRTNDTYTTSGFLNSTTLTLGDSTPPRINSFSLSGSSVTVSTESTTITLNCTDTELIGIVRAEITDPNTAKTNLSMTLSSGNLYTLAYTPTAVGTYTVLGYCLDGSSNTNVTNTTLTFSATPAPIPAAAGGGGGGAAQQEACGFEILQPANKKASNAFCPIGGTSKEFPFTLYNTIGSDRDFEVTTEASGCTFEPASISAAGNSQARLVMANCDCPTTASPLEFPVKVSQGSCTDTITVTLYGSRYGNIVGSPLFWVLVGTVGAAFLVLIIFFGTLIKKKSQR